MNKGLFLIISLLLFFMPVANSQDIPGITRSDIIEVYNGKSYYIHFVKPGQTLSAISKAYTVSVDVIKAENIQLGDEVKPNQIIKIPVGKSPSGSISAKTQPGESQNFIYHTVKEKETLFSLSREYGVSIEEIRNCNPVIMEKGLLSGQVIKIPSGQDVGLKEMTTEHQTPWQTPGQDSLKGYIQYTIKPKETLYGLSKVFHISIDELIKINPTLANGPKIGQIIRIPDNRSSNVQFTESGKDTLVYYIYHKTKKNDTPVSIADKYGVRPDDLYLLNPNLEELIENREEVKIPVKDLNDNPQAQAGTLYRVTYKPPPVEKPSATAVESSCQPIMYKGETYNIALMIPFYLEEYDSILNNDTTVADYPSDYPSFRYIQFYEGALIAIDSLAEMGFKSKIFVYDVDENTSKTREVLSEPQLKKMDIIIGPLFRKSFSIVSQFAKVNHIKIVNPFSSSDEILKDNPQVFKVQPSWQGQLKLLSDYLISEYPGATFIIARQNTYSHQQDLDYLKSQLNSQLTVKYFGDTLRVRNYLKDLNYGFDSINSLRNNIAPTRKNIVISLSDDRLFVIKLISSLISLREYYDITLFGISEWENFDLEIPYLLKLDLHLFSSGFVEYSNQKVELFIKKYREKFKGEPSEDKFAFEGFDITYFFLTAIKTYGKDFEKCLQYLKLSGLNCNYHFIRQDSGGFENNGVNIYKYENYQRIKVN